MYVVPCSLTASNRSIASCKLEIRESSVILEIPSALYLTKPSYNSFAPSANLEEPSFNVPTPLDNEFVPSFKLFAPSANVLAPSFKLLDPV